MSLRFTSTPVDLPDDGRAVFVSASIPDPRRWSGAFDPLEITDAVVALARTFLTAGWRLVTAAHPTIAPLLLYVAAELPGENRERVIVYQSDLFESVLPTATRRFEAEGIGTLVWTPAAPNDQPEPGKWDESLSVMRRQMLETTSPSAALFVGGMEGIPAEFNLFSELYPERPVYALGAPGGAARDVAQRIQTRLRNELLESNVYPSLWTAVLEDLDTPD